MKENEGTKSFSPASVLRALRRRKLFLLLPVLLLTPAIAFYALRMPPRFRARALVGSDPAIAGRSSLVRPDALVALNAQDQLRAIRETILSTPVLERVIREFRLYNLPPASAPAVDIEAMRARVEIQVEGPESFYVGFEGAEPVQVRNVANRLAGMFLDRKSDLRGRRVEQEDNFLDSEVGVLQTQLRDEEDNLKLYKQGVAGELPERLAANLKQLENLQQQIHGKTDQITEAEARRSTLTEEVNALAGQGVLDTEAPARTGAEITLDQLRVKLRDLKTRYTSEHPEIRQTATQIQELEAAKTPAPVVRSQPTPVQLRYLGLQAELKSIGPRLESYRRERDALTADVQTFERRVNSAPAFETAVSKRARDASLTRTRYEALLARQQEAKLSHRAEKTDNDFSYRIIEPAQTPASPSGPHRVRIIVAGFLGSLALGLLGVFIAERANPSFETAEELEAFTGLPVLSSVPSIQTAPERAGMGKNKQPGNESQAFLLPGNLTAEQSRHFQEQRLAPLTDPGSVAAQQYSILALKVHQWMAQTGGKTLLVSSSSGAEGKSLTALNLSLALAAISEGRVLLVDGDLRLPQVHERLGMKQEKGFGDLLAPRGGEIDGYISRIGALDVLPGGIDRTNPIGLLASGRTREILARLKSRYDVIVVDSPPVVPVADSQILADLCDGVVFVVRARQTRPELLLRALESLGAPKVIGLVLNDVELGATPYAYAYRYYQRHYLGRS